MHATTRLADASGGQGIPVSHQGLFRTPSVLEMGRPIFKPGARRLEQAWEGETSWARTLSLQVTSGVTLARPFRLSALRFLHLRDD